MKISRPAFRIWSAAFLIALTQAACSTTGNAGTGADGEVKGSVQEMSKRAKAAMKDYQIELTHAQTSDSGHRQDISGTSGTEDVTIYLISTGNDTTHVEVTAKKGALSWDKDLAQKILGKIIQG